MKTYVPNYYNEFKCIADKCRHSCCIGWDVEIDADTLEKYKNSRHTLADEIRVQICTEEDGSYFKMKEDGRCPFLQNDGLCEIIKVLGENELCDICRLHPRFKNVFTDRVEIGLGACCEEAARIILTWDKPFALVLTEGREECNTDFEEELLSKRDEMLRIMSSDKMLSEKLSLIADIFDLQREVNKEKNYLTLFKSLEYMKPDLICLIEGIEKNALFSSEKIYKCISELERPMSSVATYFIFRHISPAENRAELRTRCALVLLLMRIALAIVATDYERFMLEENSAELLRIISSEIEYSPDNMEILLSELDFDLNF